MDFGSADRAGRRTWASRLEGSYDRRGYLTFGLSRLDAAAMVSHGLKLQEVRRARGRGMISAALRSTGGIQGRRRRSSVFTATRLKTHGGSRASDCEVRMALVDHVVMVREVGVGRSLESLVEEFAWRVPVSAETLSQLDYDSRRFYMKRLQQHTAPPLSELAARCVRNEGLRHVHTVALPLGPRRYHKRAQSAPVPERIEKLGRKALIYRRYADVVDSGLRVFAQLSNGELQTSAVGVA
jgi:hypothetical protein